MLTRLRNTSSNKSCVLFTLGVLLTLANGTSLAHAAETAGPGSDSSRKPRGSGAGTESMMPMPLVAPLFLENEHFSSTITMIDTVNDPADAEVTLSDSYGMAIIKKVIHLTPHSQYRVAVKDLLTEARSAATVGSISIMHNIPDSMPVAAQLSIVSNSDAPADVEEEFLMPSGNGTSVLRAVALQGPTLIAFKSMSLTSQKLKISCLSESGKSTTREHELASMELFVERVCKGSSGGDREPSIDPEDEDENGGEAVAIEVSSSGMPGELLAFGIASAGAEQKKELTSIYFFDPATLQSGATVYTGVPVGTSGLLGGEFHPRLAVANFSAKSTTVAVMFAPTFNSTPSPQVVGQFVLPARSVKNFELDGLKGEGHLQNSFVINSDAETGSVLTKMISAGEGPLKVVEFQPKDPNQPENSGTHPWSVEDGVTSTLLLFNHANAPKTFNVNVHAAGVEWQQAYQLAAMQTMAISINRLISDQVSDRTGQKLPKTVLIGQLEWVNPNPQEGTGRLLQSNPSRHLARSFSCGQCGVVCGATLSPGSLLALILNGPDGFLGDIGTKLCIATTCTQCSGSPVTTAWSGYTYTWQSNNPSIAPVDGATNQSRANFKPLLVGGTTGLGQTQGGSCRASVPGPITVKPTISGSNTLWWFNGLGLGVSGYASAITLTANSGGTGTSYQWAITAGSDKVSLSPSTSATVNVASTGQSKTANDVSITVTVGGITSDPFKLTVRAPYTLGQDPAHPTPVYGRDLTYVWNIYIYYQMLDNLLTPLPASVAVNENWTTSNVADYQNENWRPPAAGCGTSAASAPAELWDFIQGETSDRYPTPVYNTNQNGAAVHHLGQEWRIGTCTIGSGPRVQTDTFQKYVDHAAHTGITSPAP